MENVMKWALLVGKALPEIMRFVAIIRQASDKTVSVEEFQKTLDEIDRGQRDIEEAVDRVFDEPAPTEA